MKKILPSFMVFIMMTGLSIIPLSVVSADATANAMCSNCTMNPSKSDPRPFCPTVFCKGLMCEGMCGATGQCKGIMCSQGDGTTDKASAGGAEQVMKMAQDLLGKLMQGGGGGGGGGESTPTQPIAPVVPTLGDNLLNNLNNLTNGSSSIGAVLSNLTDSLLNTPATPVSEQIQNQTPTTATPPTTATTNNSEGVPGEPTTPARPPTGTSNATTSPLLAGLEKPKSGFGAFFGGDGVINSICKSKPWETSIVSQIFPPKFFDAICAKVGYVPAPKVVAKPAVSGEQPATLSCPQGALPGSTVSLRWQCPAGTASSGTGFDTKGAARGEVEVAVGSSTRQYSVACGRGGSSSCTIEVIRPVVQIVAHPARVQLGTRTKIYWTSSGVLSCDVTGPNFKETGVQGAATTASINESTQYTIACKTASGVVVTGKTFVDIGRE